MALADLLNGAEGIPNPLSPKKPHFPAKAKNVLFLFMPGGGSQPRRQFDAWQDWAKQRGAKGLAYVLVGEDGTLTGPVAKNITDAEREGLEQRPEGERDDDRDDGEDQGAAHRVSRAPGRRRDRWSRC